MNRNELKTSLEPLFEKLFRKALDDYEERFGNENNPERRKAQTRMTFGFLIEDWKKRLDEEVKRNPSLEKDRQSDVLAVLSELLEEKLTELP